MRPIDPNGIYLADITPVIQKLKEMEDEARRNRQTQLYVGICRARQELSRAPRIGAREFIQLETGKTLRQLCEELSLAEVLSLIEKLYYEHEEDNNGNPNA